jgi:hypothetical protein
MHNKFVELKSAATGGSDKAVVDELERGEGVGLPRVAPADVR